MTRIKILERTYVEEMNSLTQPNRSIGDELQKLGITLEIIKDDPNVIPNSYKQQFMQ